MLVKLGIVFDSVREKTITCKLVREKLLRAVAVVTVAVVFVVVVVAYGHENYAKSCNFK